MNQASNNNKIDTLSKNKRKESYVLLVNYRK